MFEVMRFWLDKGVDGFRVDVLWRLIKDDQFRDNPPNPDWKKGDPEIDRLLELYSADRPEVHPLVAEMRGVIDAYPERVLIGELYLPIERMVTYYGPNLDEANLPFNFQLVENPWSAEDVGRIIRDYEAALPPGAWPNWVLSNHDRMRLASRAGPAQARVAAMLLMTLRGTPTMYYGDELGLEQVHIPKDRVQDPWARNEPDRGRDPCRTPMPWEKGPNAGFTTGEPWLPLNDDYEARNVAVQDDDPGSILSLYRRLIALRRSSVALTLGDVEVLRSDGGVLVYERRSGEARMLIALNFTGRPLTAQARPGRWRRVISTDAQKPEAQVEHALELGPDEGVILERRS